MKSKYLFLIALAFMLCSFVSACTNSVSDIPNDSVSSQQEVGVDPDTYYNVWEKSLYFDGHSFDFRLTEEEALKEGLTEEQYHQMVEAFDDFREFVEPQVAKALEDPASGKLYIPVRRANVTGALPSNIIPDGTDVNQSHPLNSTESSELTSDPKGVLYYRGEVTSNGAPVSNKFKYPVNTTGINVTAL